MTFKKQTKTLGKKVEQQPQNYDPIYTVGRAADLLESTERTLAEKFRTGELEGYKKLGRWYTTYSNIINFLTS